MSNGQGLGSMWYEGDKGEKVAPKPKKKRHRRELYLDYATDTMASGGKAKTMTEWLKTQNFD